MTVVWFALIAVLGGALGAAVVWTLQRRRVPELDSVPGLTAAIPTEDLPYLESIDELAAAVDTAFASGSQLRLIGIYTGRDSSDALDAVWRAKHLEPGYLPLSAPATLHIQLSHPRLVDPEELARGLRMALGAAAADVEAGLVAEQSRVDAASVATALNENPFEIEDSALAMLPQVVRERDATRNSIAPPTAADVASRIVAASWRGPFGWRGLVVAQPVGTDRGADLERLASAISEIGLRMAVHCELRSKAVATEAAIATTRAEVFEEIAHVASQTPTPPSPRSPITPLTPIVPETPVAPARLQRATARVADALMTPRRIRDVLRATIALLADGLATDRCFAVEVTGLHTLPVEHEKRSEAASTAIGVEFGNEFLQAVRARIGPTITAITLDAHSGPLLVPAHATAQLGPVSRMIVPVLEKGRIVVVFVAEWIDLSKKWSPDDASFAEKVVARAAVARERLLQFDALAELAAHARSEQEQMAEVLGQLQSVMAALPEAVIGLDADGRITLANQSAARLLGKQEFELMGRRIEEAAATLTLIDPSAWDHVMAADAPKCFSGAMSQDRFKIDVTVIPGLDSGVCDRLISLREILSPAQTGGNGIGSASTATVQEFAERLGRLLGGLELIAGGAYGSLSPTQADALSGARRVGTDLRVRLDEVLRNE